MTSSSAGGAAFLTGFWAKLNSELAQLLLFDIRGRAAHRIDPGLVLREGDHVAQIRLLCVGHHHPVDPEGAPRVRRSPHRERVEKKAELRPLLLGSEREE